MARFIAFYLPQYHIIPENNEWWGPGFTEWTSVARAKPLFRGHKQPHIPADLGFYDLRVPETREAQAQLAKEAGVEGFCYWHYWFGNGKRLLERPFTEVVSSGKPDFPFCLAWANHSWYKKQWDLKAKGKDILLIEQKYLGVKDYEDHFYALLEAFKDKRYIKVNGKLFFGIYSALTFEDIRTFISTWRRLAKDNGLNDFYFVAQDAESRDKEKILALGIDAVYNNNFTTHHNLPLIKKAWLLFRRKYLHQPTVFEYKDVVKDMIIDDCRNRDAIPTIEPNWDHSPRSGHKAFIYNNPDPKYFHEVACKAIEIVKDKPDEEQIVMIKSWNEWGEGNYMEPDAEYGKGYIKALASAIDKYK